MSKRVVGVVQVFIRFPFRHPPIENLDEILVIDLTVFRDEDLDINLL